jgi:hypothetical protein
MRDNSIAQGYQLRLYRRTQLHKYLGWHPNTAQGQGGCADRLRCGNNSLRKWQSAHVASVHIDGLLGHG